MANARLSTTASVRAYVDWQVTGCVQATRPTPDWTEYLRNYMAPINSKIIFAAPGKKEAWR